MEKELFTYHKEPIKVIGIIPYENFIKRHNKKSFFYFFTLYVNSLVYINRFFSENDILTKLNYLMKSNYEDYNEDIKLELIKNAIKSINNGEDIEFYTNYRNFVWNNFELNKKFDNDLVLINKYKEQIKLKYNKIKGYENKISSLLDDINTLSTLNKRDLINELIKKKYDKKLIYKVIKENDIVLVERSKTYCKLDNLFLQLFNNQDNIKETITNDFLIELFSKQIKISERTLIRYKNDNPNIQIKIDNINNYKSKEIIIEEPKKEKVSFKSDLNNLNFLDEEDTLKVEKVISWSDMEALDSKLVEEWTDEDELEFKKVG